MERCPDTGKLHVQGYLRYSAQIAFASIQPVFVPGHIELCMGNEQQNVEYCSKAECRVIGPFEWGVRASQGKRNDLVVVREKVASGASLSEIVMDAEVRSYQGLRSAQFLLGFCERERDFIPEVRWYFGETGGGKTQSVVQEFVGKRVWWSQKNLQWWEGYDGHEVVCFDDFRRDFCTFHELLRLFDSTPYRVMVKGSSRQLLAKVMIVTCPWDAEVLFESRSAEDVQQLLRRITVRRQFGNIVPPPVQAQPIFKP